MCPFPHTHSWNACSFCKPLAVHFNWNTLGFRMSTGKGGGGKGRVRGGKPKGQDGKKGDPLPSRYVEMFQEYRDELDARHDKYERLVKLSRDCTIHSKRAIFTLHQFTGNNDSKEKILSEAEAKIRGDILPNFHSIAVEISEEDPHRFHRAFSPGVQEFIEALAYYKYLKSGRLLSFSEAQEFLSFIPIKKQQAREEEEKCDAEKESPEETGTDSNESSDAESKSSRTLLQLSPSDFVLGLADLTGELMRLCINSVGSGNRELPFSLLPFFRALFRGFHSFSPGIKYMGQKMSVLRSSLGKVEHVCYTLKVRGSEIPKYMLMDVINTNEHVEVEEA